MLQSWSFAALRITIGRGEEESITLSDPYVSRLHAELLCGPLGWILHSRGRNGIYVDGRRVDECQIADGSTFRLGPSGPVFQFGAVPALTGLATLSFDPESMVFLALDRKELEQQVQTVSETDYFRTLQAKARDMRRQRASGNHPGGG